MIDIGRGAPIVVIPGLQGRWEWMRPGIEALARRHRVVSYSLADEPSSGFPRNLARGFAGYVDQVGEAMDRAGLAQAIVAGVSYGGLIAAEFAARHPGRVSALVLASALPCGWTPDARARFYMRAPRLLGPLFVATAPRRLSPEVAAALPAVGERLRFLARHTLRVATAPTSPARMARRIRWMEAHDFAAPALVTAPALVVTGEDGLDRVVPVSGSQQWVRDLGQARHVVLARTGHLGIITRPDAFADLVERFVDADRIPA